VHRGAFPSATEAPLGTWDSGADTDLADIRDTDLRAAHTSLRTQGAGAMAMELRQPEVGSANTPDPRAAAPSMAVLSMAVLSMAVLSSAALGSATLGKAVPGTIELPARASSSTTAQTTAQLTTPVHFRLLLWLLPLSEPEREALPKLPRLLPMSAAGRNRPTPELVVPPTPCDSRCLALLVSSLDRSPSSERLPAQNVQCRAGSPPQLHQSPDYS